MNKKITATMQQLQKKILWQTVGKWMNWTSLKSDKSPNPPGQATGSCKLHSFRCQ